MTLREEILKNSGILLESPVRHEAEAGLSVRFLTFVFDVNNTKKTIKSSDDKLVSTKPEILDFIVTADKINLVDGVSPNESDPKSKDQIKVEASIYTHDSDGDYETSGTVFRGADADKIIRSIVSKKKDEMLNYADELIDMYEGDIKKGERLPKWELSEYDAVKFAKSYIGNM